MLEGPSTVKLRRQRLGGGGDYFSEATTGFDTIDHGIRFFQKIDQCERSTTFSVDYDVIYDESTIVNPDKAFLISRG